MFRNQQGRLNVGCRRRGPRETQVDLGLVGPKAGGEKPATAQVPRRQTRPQHVRPMLQRLLDDLVDIPAVVMGRRMDILAWNAAAVALFGDYAALDQAERNIARITFLDETSRELYADWTSCARANVAYFHLDAGRHP
jgi:hypothetical protein